ncbi:MAG: hypothetical protein ABI559_10910 [Chloroflexota bacterium]
MSESVGVGECVGVEVEMTGAKIGVSVVCPAVVNTRIGMPSEAGRRRSRTKPMSRRRRRYRLLARRFAPCSRGAHRRSMSPIPSSPP